MGRALAESKLVTIKSDFQTLSENIKFEAGKISSAAQMELTDSPKFADPSSYDK